QIVTLHAKTYSRWAGFGSAFEAKVASELADFIRERDGKDSAIWHATIKDQLLGSIAIDGKDLGERRAHLRWFIVDPSCRGIGLGKQLLAAAIDFVDKRHFTETHLWTLKGLDAARSLYERKGFVLMVEYEGDQWGARITEQRWVRKHSVSR
ncbi:MAG: GNAT family N-acetyltransferase, partial [Geminicoccaceae bacterium]